MITKPKQKSLSVLIKELDTIFSQYIRLRDSDAGGTVICFVTGERVFWKDSDCAHYISRGVMATRFDEMNCHATTVETNRYDLNNHQEKYRIAMRREYGGVALTELHSRANSLRKFMRSDIEEMISDYKEKVKALRKQKGL